MKIVQSFWSKPLYDTRCIKPNGGWPHKRYYYMSRALSCLQLRKFYDKVELVTDRRGRKVLLDLLDLPYTSVTEELDVLDRYPSLLWSAGKIFTCGLQQQHFIHVDENVYVYKNQEIEWEQANLFAQSKMAINVPAFENVLNYLLMHYKNTEEWMPDKSPGSDPFCFYNSGVFGGRNFSFIHQFVQKIFDFIDENIQQIENIHDSILETFYFDGVDGFEAFNSLIESYLFGQMVKNTGTSVACLFETDDPTMQDCAGIIGAGHHRPYVHAVYWNKRTQTVCDELEFQLRKDYPGYYYKIVQALNNYCI